MNGLAVIKRLHAHRQWVNRHLRQAAAHLSDEQLREPAAMGQGSLWATLVHLYAAEAVWLAVLKGDSAAKLAGPEAFDTFEQLQIAWEATERRWLGYLDELKEAALDRPVYRTGSDGKSRATSTADALLHVCTHAQYTAAQAVNMLRHRGASDLPKTMLITMAREQSDTELSSQDASDNSGQRGDSPDKDS